MNERDWSTGTFPVRELYVWRSQALFGIQARDRVLNRTVAEGLSVMLYDTSTGAAPLSLQPNGDGIFVIHRLPDGSTPASLSAGAPYCLELRDRHGRYLPMRYPLGPLKAGDVINLELYSAPGHALPAGVAVLRAQFEEAVTGAPAAFAVAEVTLPGRQTVGGKPWVWQGVADQRGVMALPFPYPPVVRTLVDRVEQNSLRSGWTMQFEVHYGAVRPTVYGDPPAASREQLLAQGRGSIATGSSAFASTIPFTLNFGQEVILSPTGTRGERIRIRPAT
ncbi:MAG: hypothetical protein ACM3XM_05550 [Mycobacterium leprae]